VSDINLGEILSHHCFKFFFSFFFFSFRHSHRVYAVPFIVVPAFLYFLIFSLCSLYISVLEVEMPSNSEFLSSAMPSPDVLPIKGILHFSMVLWVSNISFWLSI
jgi:hypothetical protein